MKSLLESIRGGNKGVEKSRSQSPLKRRTLALESLETRAMMTASPYVSSDGTLHFEAHDGPGDYFHVSLNDKGTQDIKDDVLNVVWSYAEGGAQVTEHLTFKRYFYAFAGDYIKPIEIDFIHFQGGNGDDTFYNNTPIESQLYGMSGDDLLSGGSYYDMLDGGKGSDTLYGNGFNDYIYGNGPSQGGIDPGAIDMIFGGDLHDTLIGGHGQTNYIYGGSGNDKLTGGDYASMNFLDGGTGDDWLFGGSGKVGGAKAFNQLTDSSGKDTFIGGDRAYNYMFALGGAGNDVVVPGQVGSVDYWWIDNGDLVWLWGPYPVKP